MYNLLRKFLIKKIKSYSTRSVLSNNYLDPHGSIQHHDIYKILGREFVSKEDFMRLEKSLVNAWSWLDNTSERDLLQKRAKPNNEYRPTRPMTFDPKRYIFGGKE